MMAETYMKKIIEYQLRVVEKIEEEAGGEERI
jgi:hypothetical protein